MIVLFSGQLVLKRQAIKCAGDNNKSQSFFTKPIIYMCAQLRSRSACAFAQSDKLLQHALENTAGPNLAIECTLKTDQTRQMPC